MFGQKVSKFILFGDNFITDLHLGWYNSIDTNLNSK